MLAFNTVADVLGLHAKETTGRSPFSLISRIEHGLPIAALERVVHVVEPGDAQFKYRLVPKGDLREAQGRASASSDEGTRLARVARIWSLALDVWQNDDDARLPV